MTNGISWNLLAKWTRSTQITKFIGPTCGPPGSCRPQMGPMLAPWTLLLGYLWEFFCFPPVGSLTSVHPVLQQIPLTSIFVFMTFGWVSVIHVIDFYWGHWWTIIQKSVVKNHPMMMSLNGNLFRVTGPLCGEFTSPRWIPRTKASDAELWCFLWSAPWINGWVNTREAGDLRFHRADYEVIVMHIAEITFNRLRPEQNGCHFVDNSF